MPVSSGHDQVCLLGTDKLQELGCNRPAGALPDFIRHNDTVAHQVTSDVGQIPLVLGFRIFLADFDDQDFLGRPQKWKRVADRAPAFTGILARDHDATKLEWTNDVGHHQDGPACPQQNGARLDQVAYVAARARWPDKDNVRRPCLPRHQLGSAIQERCAIPPA